MIDTIEKIGQGSVIQHGKHNNRIYGLKIDSRDIDYVLNDIGEIATKNNYSKIICKVPKNYAPLFSANGFILEAYIPGFYKQKRDVFFMSKFLNSDRIIDIENKKLIHFSEQLTEIPNLEKENSPKKTSKYSVRKLNVPDIEQITSIYKEVFKTYPFPIHEPDYILKTMKDNVVYFGAAKRGKLVALSSAEVDFKGANAEMTDFATLPTHTGNGLSKLLLKEMESEMKQQGILLLYTIARLKSNAMNKTFLRYKYKYSGTLIKNTNIAGNIESMNVYYKMI